MTTSKPRVQVTLRPELYGTISRLAALQGCSRSRVVGELLEAVHPPLVRTVALLDAAREAPEQVRAGIVEVVQGMEQELLRTYGGALNQLDWLHGVAQREEGPGTGGRSGGYGATPAGPGPSAAGSNPRVVTRGSGGARKPRKRRGGQP